jgi:DNA-directed RNA polymerase specialized sigma subunit
MIREDLQKEIELEEKARLLIQRGYIKGKSLQEVIQILLSKSQ